MARQFQRGQKARLSDLTLGTDLYVGVQITGPGLTFDIACFGLDASERLSDDRYFIFYNQTKSPEESLQLLGAQAGDTESFRVTLDRVPATVDKLSFTATIDGAGTMSQVGPGYLRIVAGGEEVARYSFDGSEFSSERAVMLGDIYRKDGWRFAAVGQGFDGGLAALLKNFGGEVLEEEEQQPQAAPGGAPGFAPPGGAAPQAATPGFAPPGGAAPQPAPSFAPPAGGAPASSPAAAPPPAPAAPQPAPAPAPPAPAAPQPVPAAGPAAPPPAPAPDPTVPMAPPGAPAQPGFGPGAPAPGAPPQPFPAQPGPQAAPPGGFGPGAPAPGMPAPGMPAPGAPAPYGAPDPYGQPPQPGQPQPPGGQPYPQPGQAGPPPIPGQPQPQGQPPASLHAALNLFRVAAEQRRWSTPNPQLVRADLSLDRQPFLARQGSMVMYHGDVEFSFKGGGLKRRFAANMTGEGFGSLMRCTGSGQVYLAEEQAHLHVVELQGDALCIASQHVLAFDESLESDVRRIDGHGIPGGSLFALQLSGHGSVVISTRGEPVVLPVTPMTFADANAVVAWSSAVQVLVTNQVRLRRHAFPGHSGETTQLQFRGAPGNFAIVQPYEI
ncbi:TerD family protein [Streptomyces sp. 4N509B]|uniref:TerD family protein n=1 Tax=Streptomyces sp. 4N509B TaxID=3457413 RepID=UPI003FD0EF1F